MQCLIFLHLKEFKKRITIAGQYGIREVKSSIDTD